MPKYKITRTLQHNFVVVINNYKIMLQSSRYLVNIVSVNQIKDIVANV